MNIITQSLAEGALLSSIHVVDRGAKITIKEGAIEVEQPPLALGSAQIPRPLIAVGFDPAVHRIIIERA